ncbi:BlaI/MecI/CopY family transcriptional regulator [Undibacterium sp. Ji50W]|uniref:BlaI/MecI/CopY family transcriptional regulator n=1 Tax=Undibacterium sp. Ji50W TaxID=3413041 RepID=UPI003BF0E3CB
MSKNTSRKPTAAELDLLRLIWQTGPATVKEVHQAAIKDRPELSYATVLRLMQVMHTKGLLNRDEEQRSHIYAAAQAQDSLQTNLLKDLIYKAFSGSAKDLVMAALRGHVSKEERAEIQKLLNEEKK